MPDRIYRFKKDSAVFASKRLVMNIICGSLLASTVNIAPVYAQIQPAKEYDSVPAVPIKRCANLGNMFEQPNDGKGWGGRKPVRNDLKEIAAVGFDTVRFPIRWSAFADEKPPYTIKPELFREVDEVVGWALQNNLNIIVDLHHYDEIFENPEAHKARLIGIWAQIADHYKSASPKVMFEILNEPHNKLTNDVVEPILAETVAEIRKTNPKRKIIVGGDFWSGISSLATFDPPKDPNIIATFHFYEPFNFTHQGASWINPSPPAPRAFGSDEDYTWMDKMTDATVAFQKRTGIPVFMGEFGAIDSANLKERARYTYAVRAHAEDLGIGWCVWSYTNTFHIRRDDGWIPIMVAALGLPPKTDAAKPAAK
jgi:endoglucanase